MITSASRESEVVMRKYDEVIEYNNKVSYRIVVCLEREFTEYNTLTDTYYYSLLAVGYIFKRTKRWFGGLSSERIFQVKFGHDNDDEIPEFLIKHLYDNVLGSGKNV